MACLDDVGAVVEVGRILVFVPEQAVLTARYAPPSDLADLTVLLGTAEALAALVDVAPCAC